MGPFVLGRALSRNKIRTSLAALGIVIGVGAVICTVAIGEGAAVQVERSISAIGVNFVWVEAGSVNVAGVRTGGYGTRTLVEDDAVAIVGGALGVLAGTLGARAVSTTLEWLIYVSPRAVTIALAISASIGVFFGLYPASKAARLDPIRALQFE